MTRFKGFGVVLLILATVLGLAVPAQANGSREPRPSVAYVIPIVKIDRNDHRVAHFAALYRCSGEGTLWVSVKQTADRKADPRLAEEGSSAIAAAWSDSHRNPVDCDGRFHIDEFTVDQEELDFTSGLPKSEVYGPLAPGKAWVQFCLFDDTTGEEIPVSSMVFSLIF